MEETRKRGRPPGKTPPPPGRDPEAEFAPIRAWFIQRKWAKIVTPVAERAGIEPTGFHKMLEGTRTPTAPVIDAVKKVITEELGYRE